MEEFSGEFVMNCRLHKNYDAEISENFTIAKCILYDEILHDIKIFHKI